MKKTLAFLGCGNMAGAIIEGADNFNIRLYNRTPEKCDRFKGERFCKALSVAEALEGADYVFLCVKPQNVDELLPLVAECDVSDKVLVSIMAGVTIDRLNSYFDKPVAIIRTMPNTPLKLGKGVTALCRNENVTDKQFSDICRLFSSMGSVLVTQEDKINAVTSAFGSAPAYVYLFVKAIADEAKAQGLDNKNIEELVAKMVIGSCHMILEEQDTVDELIKKVCSPKGTTEQAMKVFEDKQLTDIVAKAMQACTKRAEELSN